MIANELPRAIVDFSINGGAPQRLSFRNPVRTVETHQIADVRAAICEAESAAKSGFYAVGFVSYAAARAFDPAFVTAGSQNMPLVWFGIFEDFDTLRASEDLPRQTAPAWKSNTTVVEYCRTVDRIREAIAEGAVYQVNYATQLTAKFAEDPFELYESMRRTQQCRYGAFIDTGRWTVLSASPELFFRKVGDAITTRPMKGTAPRGRWPAEDREMALALAKSEKNRAENLMIVDLLRNDLGKIALTGTVEARCLFEIETYPTIFQMVSTVQAALPQGTSLDEVFAALFPSGSITGAPKISAMKIIAAAESQPREIYTGAVGMITPHAHTAVFNVAIRTAWIDPVARTIAYGAGGAITWDSDAPAEYAEVAAKASIVTNDMPNFRLLETMRLDNGVFRHLSNHLERIRESAEHFGYRFDLGEMSAALEQAASSHTDGVFRARLQLSACGKILVEVDPMPHTPAEPCAVCLAPRCVDRFDRFLYHKTTERTYYNELRRERPDVFDVLMWNDSGEVTEFTTGNIVVDLHGSKVTPPISCGLLAGTLRRSLLNDGTVAEKAVRIDDLASARSIWFINSLRGWLQVKLETPPAP